MLRMGTMSQWEALLERVAGKWQMPLLGLSLLMLAASLLHLRPSPTYLPLDEAVEYLDVLVSDGLYERAVAGALRATHSTTQAISAYRVPTESSGRLDCVSGSAAT